MLIRERSAKYILGVSRMSKSSKLSTSNQAHSEDLTDARTRRVVYPHINVVIIKICLVTYGAADSVAIANYGPKEKA